MTEVIIKQRTRKLNATDIRVLRYVLSHLVDALFNQTPREVSKALKLPLRTVARAFPRLVTRGILIVETRSRTKGERGKPGHPLPTVYRVNVPVGAEDMMPEALARDLEKAGNRDDDATPIDTVADIAAVTGDGMALSSAAQMPVSPLDDDDATPSYVVGDLLHDQLHKETYRTMTQTDMTEQIPHTTYVGVASSSNKGLSSPSTAELDAVRRHLAETREKAVKYAKDVSAPLWYGLIRDLERQIETLEVTVCRS